MQLPQLTDRSVPQLSVPVADPHKSPSAAQSCGSLSGEHASGGPPASSGPASVPVGKHTPFPQK
jgi:hypothetical protein